MVDKDTMIGYSSSTLKPLALLFGYNERAGEYWHKMLKNDVRYETANNIIIKTELLEEKRGGKRSTSGLYGKPKNNDW